MLPQHSSLLTRFRTSIALLALGNACLFSTAHATLSVYEGFQYNASGTLNGEDGTDASETNGYGFSAAWTSVGTNSFITASAGLGSNTLTTNGLAAQPSANGKTVASRLFSDSALTQDGNELWFSVLINNSNAGNLAFALSSSDFGTTISGAALADDSNAGTNHTGLGFRLTRNNNGDETIRVGQFKEGLYPQLNTDILTVADGNTTHLIGRIIWGINGDGTTLDLWQDPVASTSLSSPDLSWSGNIDNSIIDRIALFDNYTGTVDEIRIAYVDAGQSSQDAIDEIAPGLNLQDQGSEYTEVDLNSGEIYVQGAQFKTIDANGINFYRFNEDLFSMSNVNAKVNPLKGKTTAGVKLTLYTRSDTVKLTFDYLPDNDDWNLGSQFAAYQNGVFVEEISVFKSTASVTIELVSTGATDELIRHDLVLPSWSNPVLSKLELKTGKTLEAGNPIRTQKIAFLGDSISHGTGQGSATYKTYPYLACEKLNAQDFRLAVGGGKISTPAAEQLQYFDDLDIIWILVGYNNWQGSNHSVATITSEYEELLETVRYHQPTAKIFCNTLTYTRKLDNANTGVTAEQVRTAIASVVQAYIDAGDDQLYLIRPEEFTDDSYLRFEEDGITPTTDTVHFSELGAAMFAEDVYRILNPHLMPEGATGVWEFNVNNTGNTENNRATEDGIHEATEYIDGAITFDAVESEALSGRALVAGYDFGNDQSMSLEMDIKLSNITGQNRLLRMYEGTTKSGIFAGIQNGQVIFKLDTHTLLGSTVITPNEWHTIAVTWNSETDRATVYLDGIEENTAVFTGAELQGPETQLLILGNTNCIIDNVTLSNN